MISNAWIRRSRIAGSIAGILLLSANAQGAITLNNWTFDNAGVPGLNNGVQIDNVDRLGFNQGRARIYNTGGAPSGAGGSFAAGDTARVEGLLTIDDFLDDPTVGSINPAGLNAPGAGGGGGTLYSGSGVGTAFEVTIQFAVDITWTSPFTYVHTPSPGTTFLDVYVDGDGLGTTKSNNATALGFTDGVLIASFKDRSDGTGVFDQVNIGGSDFANFDFVSGLAGVLFSDSTKTVDLTVGSPPPLIGLEADSVISPADPPAIPAAWPGVFAAVGSPAIGVPALELFLRENGDAVLIPEPMSCIVWGMFISFGMVVNIARRRITA